MATYDLPAWLRAATFEWGIRKGGMLHASPYNGATQAIGFASDAWECGITIPPRLWLDAGAPEAFFANLAGGVHRLRVPHLGRRRGEPLGTLRAAPTLASTMAAGSRTMLLGNARGPRNLIPYSALANDINADGLCDSLGVHVFGVADNVVASRGPHTNYTGLWYQQVRADNLGSGGGGGVGALLYATAAAPGQAYAASVDLRHTSGSDGVLYMAFINTGGATLGAHVNVVNAVAGQFVRVSVSGVAPAGTATVLVYAYTQRFALPGATHWIDIARPQVELTATATEFDGPATIRAGDMLGVAGQLFMAASDATANDNAEMTVPTVNAARAPIASGQAVTWQAPTCQMIMPAQAFRAVHVPGLLQAITVDLVEAA